MKLPRMSLDRWRDDRLCLGKCLFSVLLICFGSLACATVWSGLGGSIHQYPTGTIVGIDKNVSLNPLWELSFGPEVNFAYHGGQGIQASENGKGFGISGSLRNFPWTTMPGLFVGGELSIFRMNIDWSTPPLEGTSHLFVFQPTIELGYSYLMSEHVDLRLALEFGYEVNTFVQGASTGQGLIGLVLVSFNYIDQ